MEKVNWDDLVDRALKGEQRAYSRLFILLEPIICKTIRKRIYAIDKGSVEDIKQDILAKIYLRLNTFLPGRNFITWAISIAIYHCIDISRKHKMNFVYENNMAKYSDKIKECSPEDHLLSVEGKKDVGNFVRENLTPKQTESIFEKYFLGLKQKDIACKSNSPLGTVSGNQFHTMKALRNKITELNLNRLDFL